MASLPLIELIRRQALSTFCKVSGSVTSSFDENVLKLKKLMNKVTSEDVSLDPNLLQSGSNGTDKSTGIQTAPVAYIEILDDQNCTIGIFVLNQGARLPLHDHPLMHGILKVIHGTVLIQSYSVVTDKFKQDGAGENSSQGSTKSVQPEDINLSKETLHKQVEILARKEPAILLSFKDEASVLSPIEGNLHEIHSVDGPAAFIDILSPPYSTDIPGVGSRPCRYFKEVGDKVLENDQDKRPVKKLLRISSPSDYWSRSAPYQGP